MNKRVVIFDDVQIQAEELEKALSKNLPNVDFRSSFLEQDMLNIVDEDFFSLAIVDLRMDDFEITGIDIIKKIKENNPFSKIVVVSAFTKEFLIDLQPFLTEGLIFRVSEKESFETWIPKLVKIIEEYYESYDERISVSNMALLDLYSTLKNEPNSYRKGELFERFIALLFGNMGFNNIQKRVKGAGKELDLLIRNDIEDEFLSKFGKYIFVECKNKKKSDLTKNDLVSFMSKIKQSSGMCEFGVFCVTTRFPSTFTTELIREAQGNKKMLLLSNIEIEKLISSYDKRATLKKFIDEQVKNS